MGVKTSKHFETYDLSLERWVNRSDIVNDLYNNTRFVYQSDKGKDDEKGNLPNNDTQEVGENEFHYLHNKDTDADAFIDNETMIGRLTLRIITVIAVIHSTSKGRLKI